MSAIALAVGVAGAAASVYGSTKSAKSAKNAQSSANEANLQATRETNELNKQMFDESRGSTGHAFLPTYTGNAEKQTFEDLYNIYQSGLTPAQRQAQAQSVLTSMQPAVEGGNKYLTDVYSGANLATSQGYYQPLWDARLQAAQAQADAIRQAYAQTINQQRAAAQRQGFYGGSSVQSAEAQKALLSSIQNAALAKSNALVQNYGENAQLGLADLATRQQLLNAPISRAQSLNNYYNLPSEAAYGGYDQLANRLGLFNIGTGKFTYQQAPLVQPEIGSGQIYGSAISSLGQLGQQYALNSLYNQNQNTYNSPYVWQTTNTYQGNATPASYNAIAQAQAANQSVNF